MAIPDLAEVVEYHVHFTRYPVPLWVQLTAGAAIVVAVVVLFLLLRRRRR